MTPDQRAAAERLVEGGEPSNRLMPDELQAWADDAAHLLRELLAKPVQEPVALMWQHEETGRVTFTTMADPYVGKRWHRIPLYAAAPQQPMHCPKDGGECGAGGYCRPEQRKPLTKVQITELAEQCGYDGAVPTVRLAFQGFKLDDFARAIERAHGIVEAP